MNNMNGFKRHGIHHASPSSINQWEEAADVWVAKYLFVKKFPASAAMWRGIVVEDIVVATISERLRFDDALKAGLAKFDKEVGKL